MASLSLRNIRLSHRGAQHARPNIPVVYLGSVQILCPVGEGICGSIEEILENCAERLKHNLIPKRTMEITEFAFELSSFNDDTQEETRMIFKFKRIILCGVDGKRPKILLINYQHNSKKGRGIYRTHAFMCDTKKHAKRLALLVANHFKSALRVVHSKAPENSNSGDGLQLLKELAGPSKDELQHENNKIKISKKLEC